jgi:hypothetical protein
MIKASDLIIPIAIEFGVPSLGDWADSEASTPWRQRLIAGLAHQLEMLGLPGEPSVELRRGEPGRVVRLRVHGRLQPYPPGLMRHVWRALAPDQELSIPESEMTDHPPGFPDAWLAAYAAGSAPAGQGRRWQVLTSYLMRLILEILYEYPACLVGPTQAAAYLEADPAATPPAAGLSATEEVLPVLRHLLDAWVTVRDRKKILKALHAFRTPARRPAAVAERMLAMIQPDQIEIQLHRDGFEHLSAQETGSTWIISTRLVFVPAMNLRPGYVALKINERLRPPVPGPRTGELFVDSPIDRLGEAAKSARPVWSPLRDGPAAAVPESAKATLEANGFETFPPSIFASMVALRELTLVSSRLQSTEGTDFLLSHLHRTDPELVQAVLVRFTSEEITRVLRGLTAEGIPIRDLRLILGRLLHYDTVPFEPGTLVVLDDRVPIGAPGPGGVADSSPLQVEFVRRAMRPFFAETYIRDGKIPRAVGLDLDLERRTMAAARSGRQGENPERTADREQEVLRDAIWSALGRMTTASDSPIVIVTSPFARIAVRDLIARELPGLPVLSRLELPPGMQIRPVEAAVV